MAAGCSTLIPDSIHGFAVAPRKMSATSHDMPAGDRPDVWLNGSWVRRVDARVSAFDAGLQHGVGLFETMSARDGRVLRLREHLARLVASVAALRLSESLRAEPLAEAVEQTVERTGLSSARVRLTVTGGDLNLVLRDGSRPQHHPTILIVAQPPTPYPPALFENGIVISVAGFRSNPLDPMAGHKTLWYWPRLAALQQASAAGAGEALVLSVTNHLAGGCVSNLFLVKDGVVSTPIARGEEAPDALRSPVLPGITRQWVVDEFDRRAIPVERRMLSIDDLLSAEECFLTNSSWGVLPVVAVEGATIGSGRVGACTAELRAAWLTSGP